MKGVRFIQGVLALCVPFVWWSHFYGSGQSYVHLDVAIVITVMAVLGVVVTEYGIRRGDYG